MSAVLTPTKTIAPAWRQALPVLCLLLLTLTGLYIDTARAMEGIWSRSETFAHAYLVAPISIWLVWRLRHRLAAMVPVPQPWVLLPMAVAAGVWFLGDLAGVNALTQAMFVALIVLAVPAVLGWAVARELMFPLAFLFFMVPFGEFLLPVLMEGTADFTVLAVAFSGVPVYREGLTFVIPSGTWSVVEACSGVRYLIASFMVGSLFAYLNYTSTKRRLIFCAVALVLPIVANWLRAYFIVMLGHLSGNKLAVGVDHLIYGWVFFGVVITLLFVIGARWTEPPASLMPEPPGPVLAAGPSQVAPWAMALAVAAMGAWPQALLRHMNQLPGGSQPVLALPSLPGTNEVAAKLPEFQPVFQGPSAVAQRSYAQGSGVVSVHVAYYRDQRYGQKLVTSENMLVKPGDHRWNLTTRGGTAVDVDGQRIPLRTAEVISAGALGHGGRERLDVRQVYWVDGHLTASEHWAVIHGVWSRLLGRGDDGALLTFFTAGGAEEGTGQLLDGFIRTNLGALQTQLAATRAAR